METGQCGEGWRGLLFSSVLFREDGGGNSFLGRVGALVSSELLSSTLILGAAKLFLLLVRYVLSIN